MALRWPGPGGGCGNFERKNRGTSMKLAVLILSIVVFVIASLFLGSTHLTIVEIAKAILGQGNELNQKIIWELRLPRSLMALAIGAGLGASGAALQSYTRNALAAPGILGFTATAALGAVIALYFGGSALWVTFFALVGTFIGAVLILSIAGIKKGASTLILAGVGVRLNVWLVNLR